MSGFFPLALNYFTNLQFTLQLESVKEIKLEMHPRKKARKNCRNGSIVRAVKALVLLEVLAVLSCGSIGNIKISHLHCSASIDTIGKYCSTKVLSTSEC